MDVDTTIKVLTYYGYQHEVVSDVVFADTGEISKTAKYVGSNMVIKCFSNLDNLKKEIEISKILRSFAINTPLIVLTLNNEEFIKYNNFYFVITKRLEGERISVIDLFNDDYIAKAHFIGEIIGQIDNALSKVNIKVNETNLVDTVKNFAVPIINSRLNISDDFISNFVREFEQLYDQLPRQAIHRDPNPRNIIVNGNEWEIIDFELVENNVRIFDPCYAALSILSESFDENDKSKQTIWIEITKEIMRGYDNIVGMAYVEKKAIPYILIANQLISTAFFFGKDGYEKAYKTNKAMTEWIIKNINMLSLM